MPDWIHDVLVALIMATPATIAAWAALHNRRAMDSDSDLTIGQQVEALHDQITEAANVTVNALDRARILRQQDMAYMATERAELTATTAGLEVARNRVATELEIISEIRAAVGRRKEDQSSTETREFTMPDTHRDLTGVEEKQPRETDNGPREGDQEPDLAGFQILDDIDGLDSAGDQGGQP